MNLKIISAGAGSGKTYRLTEEMVALLNPDNPNRVRANGIIATTFTNKAAAELQERVRTKLLEEGLIAEADELTNALIGTVHGLGVKLLKRFAFEAGVSPEVDIIADEDQQLMFNQSLASILTPKLIAAMEGLAERLGLNKKDRYDWRIEVKRLTDIARSNAMETSTLQESKQKSIDTFFQLLNAKPTTLSLDDFNTQLLELLDATIQQLIANDDSTKTTQRAVNTLKQFFNKLRNKGELNWHEWAKIGKTAGGVGKKSREDAVELKEFVENMESNPAFQADIKTFISNLFDLSIGAIEEYETYKKRRGLIDYIDMEISVKRLLENETVQEVLAEEVDLLMVDEFQDTSPIQLEIFWKLSQFAKYSIWVGDPKQSIYGFRGADPELMLAIIKETGGVKPEDIQKKSWRSRSDLVHAVNAIFVKAFPDLPMEQIALEPAPPKVKAKEPFQLDNALIHWHFQKDSPGKRMPGKPWMENCIAENSKTELLEKGVQVMPRDGGKTRPVRPGDIAVLCRSNHECLSMAESLHRSGLKAAIARNGLLKTAESHLILACLKFVLNQADSLSIAEILLLASKKDIETIIEHRLDFLDKRESKYEKWANDDEFIERLHALRKEVLELSSTEILNLVIETLDLRRIIAGWGNLEQRFANVDALRRYALQYEENCNRLHTAASLGGFLLWLSDLESNGIDNQGSGAGSDAVNVLTYHKSKGLEWEVVVCHSLEQNLRDDVWGVSIVSENDTIDLNNILGNRWLRYWLNPFADQIGKTNLEKNINESDAKKQATKAALAEEARLLYVGLTRARDYVIIPSRQYKFTKWLNRSWFEGKEDLQVLDPYLAGNGDTGTYESPWFWNDKNIPIDTDIKVFGELFPYTENPPEIIDYFSERAEVKSHSPFSIDTDKDDFKKEFTFKYLSEKQYSDSIQLKEEASEYIVAKVVKAFLCADSMKRQTDERLEMATILNNNFGGTEMVDPKSIVGLSQRYYTYLQQEYTIKAVYRKHPLQLIHNGRLFETIVDLIAITDKGILIVQNSGFAGKHKEWKKKAKELASWMYLTKKAVAAHFGAEQPISTCLHFVMTGGLVEFEVKVKVVQGSLF
jgi:ATP-dependent exoDNAse (exonuclease V) beta subunit